MHSRHGVKISGHKNLHLIIGSFCQFFTNRGGTYSSAIIHKSNPNLRMPCRKNNMTDRVKSIRYKTKRVLRKRRRVEEKNAEFRNENSIQDFPCICNRKPTGIYCHLCRVYTPNARFRRTCYRHPRTINHTDLLECPNCSEVTDLQELRETNPR